MQLKTGQIVKVRSRQYLVEEVAPKLSEDTDTLVRLSCLEDDALGESLEVLWEREVDAVAIGNNSWDSVAKRGFDNPKLFSAYLHCNSPKDYLAAMHPLRKILNYSSRHLNV